MHARVTAAPCLHDEGTQHLHACMLSCMRSCLGLCHRGSGPHPYLILSAWPLRSRQGRQARESMQRSVLACMHVLVLLHVQRSAALSPARCCWRWRRQMQRRRKLRYIHLLCIYVCGLGGGEEGRGLKERRA